ncbi:MAG: beta-galactosidase trimerization domain-containing protein [Verrucomicrobiae bacterium]|nr:beta-galactosidase trimerization domain-containing protein [Verrucomicrobiae bacterium]
MTARSFITRLSAALAAMLLPMVAAGGPDRAWFEGVLVGIETGPTGAQFGHSDTNDTRYCARFDGREIVRQAVAAHSEYLVLWVRDGDYAYYDSKLLPRAPGLGGRDPLREALEEARRHNLPLIAYCVVQQGGHFLKAHPEWEMRGKDGQPLGRFCYNSGYLEAMKQILAEQLAHGIDGFHMDMMDQGFGPPYGCWCDTCRTLFEQEFGQPMPKGVAWDAAWDFMLEFRYRSSERFEQALYRHIKSINSRATVDYNYHGNPPFSFEVGQRPVQHAGNGDFITGETGVWGFSPLTVGLNAQFYRAAVPHQRVQVAMQRGVRMYHDQTTRPLHDLRWELLTLLSHGAFVTVVDKTAFDGWLDSVAYERIGAAFKDAQARRAHFGQKPVAEVGIYFSSRTRDWMGREQPAKYFQSFQGAHKALVYEHIPWGVVLDENLTLESLNRFPIVLLPNAAILSDREVALLRTYVEGGGKLIITGQSGQFDRLGRPLTESALSELMGAKVKGRLESLDNWVKFPANEVPGSGTAPSFATVSTKLPAGKVSNSAEAFHRGSPAEWPFLVKGPASIYEPTTAIGVGELLKPHRTTRQLEGKEGTEWPMSADSPVGPAILLNHVGMGTVLTFACSPDFATASEHHIVEARKLIANAVRFLSPTPRIRIHAPTTVEAVVTDDPATRTLRVHLLGYNSPPQTTPAKDRPFVLPGLIEDLPRYKATLELGRDLKSAKTFNRSTKVQRRGRVVNLEVEDIHEVVILKY